MKRSMCTIAYRKTDMTIFDIIPQVAQAGYDGAEVFWPQIENLSDAELSRAKALAEQHGLDIPMISGYLGNYNLDMNNADEMLDRMKAEAPVAVKMGVKMLRAFVGWTCECSSVTAGDEYWQYNIDGFSAMAEIARQNDLTIVLETHSETLVDSVGGCRKMIDSCGPGIKLNLQLEDIAQLSKLPDEVAVYKALKDDVVHFHLSASELSDAKKQMYKSVFAAMKEDNFDGYISWENCSATGVPMESAQAGMKRMDELGV